MLKKEKVSEELSSGWRHFSFDKIEIKEQELTSAYMVNIEAKHNRKMGHVTLFSDEPDKVEEFGKGIDF